MPRKSFTIEQIISKPREAEVLLNQGQSVGDICQSISANKPITAVGKNTAGSARIKHGG